VLESPRERQPNMASLVAPSVFSAESVARMAVTIPSQHGVNLGKLCGDANALFNHACGLVGDRFAIGPMPIVCRIIKSDSVCK
jgi:hypothetical protein